MIYQDVLCDIKESLLESGYFTQFYEYASMIEVDGIVRPMYFIDGGNAVDVMNFDVNGSGYIRKTGAVSLNPSYLPAVTSCDGKLIEISLPLRGVFAVPKKKLGNNGFSDDLLAMELIDILHGSQVGVTGVSNVKGKVLRYETDRQKIWAEEVGNTTLPNIDLSYIYIDFDLTFTASAECLKRTCDYGY